MRLYKFVLILGVLFLLPGFVLPTFAQWEPERRLTFDDSTSFTSWNNAWSVAAQGDTVHAVWYDNRDGPMDNQEIYYKRSTDGGLTWGEDVRLTFNDAYSPYPAIAASPQSGVHVIWYDARNTYPKIYYRRSTDGGSTWSTEVQISFRSANSEYPSLAASGNDVHAVWGNNWVNGSSMYYGVIYRGSTNGGTTWGTELRLADSTDRPPYPSVAASGSAVHIAWKDHRDGNDEIYFRRSTDRGMTWMPETRLTNDTAESFIPSVAVSGSTVYVVWHDERTGNADIFFCRSSDGGATWGPNTDLVNDATAAYLPSVAASGSNVHIAWDDGRYLGQIYYKHSSDGGLTWDADTRITSATRGVYNPSISVSGSTVHVLWSDFRDGNPEIYYTRNPTGNGVENEGGARLFVQDAGLKPHPNPFVFFTTILHCESQWFVLYDISGRQVGTYKGDRIGEGLAPGVYFLRAEGGDGKPVRVVKVR